MTTLILMITSSKSTTTATNSSSRLIIRRIRSKINLSSLLKVKKNSSTAPTTTKVLSRSLKKVLNRRLLNLLLNMRKTSQLNQILRHKVIKITLSLNSSNNNIPTLVTLIRLTTSTLLRIVAGMTLKRNTTLKRQRLKNTSNIINNNRNILSRTSLQTITINSSSLITLLSRTRRNINNITRNLSLLSKIITRNITTRNSSGAVKLTGELERY